MEEEEEVDEDTMDVVGLYVWFFILPSKVPTTRKLTHSKNLHTVLPVLSVVTIVPIPVVHMICQYLLLSRKKVLSSLYR